EPALPASDPFEVFHDVGDVDEIAVDPRRLERLVEELAGRADEGAPDLVLRVARLLADEHRPRRGAAFAEHGLRPRFVEIAGLASGGDLAQDGKRRPRWDEGRCGGDRGAGHAGNVVTS